MIRTFCVLAAVSVYVVVVGFPALLASVITGNSDYVYDAGVAGARMGLRVAGIRVLVEGRDRIPAGRAVVFMSNHQSNCDPPALAASLPPILILAKTEVFRLPVLGRAMRLRGFVPVDRKSRERAIAAVDRAAESLKKGSSFLVFPEGTRSPDGRLQAFKKGVFVMAIKAGAPIVPISISGGSRIMRKGEFRIHPGTLRITIHDPVSTADTSLTDRTAVAAQVRRAISAGLRPDEQGREQAAG